jgi:uncharacterized RDD family membrane protein YckC
MCVAFNRIQYWLQQGVAPIESTRAYAGVWRRFAALVVDFVLLSALFFPVTRIVKGTWIMTAGNHRWARGWFVTDPLCLIFLVVIFLYFVFLEGLAGGTVGKRLLRLRVVGTAGTDVGLYKALIRNVLRVVDSLPFLGILGTILITRSPERARFGDRAAGTRVIRLSARIHEAGRMNPLAGKENIP